MGRTPRQHQLTGCRRRLPLRSATSCSCSMHLSHAKVFFRVSLLLPATPLGRQCRQSSRYLPSPFILLTGGMTTPTMAVMVVTATMDVSLTLCFFLWRGDTPSKSAGCGGSSTLIFYTTIFLWLRMIVIISTTSPGKIFGMTVGCLKSVSFTPRSGRISSFGSTVNSVLRSWQPRTTDLFVCSRVFGTTILIPRSSFSS